MSKNKQSSTNVAKIYRFELIIVFQESQNEICILRIELAWLIKDDLG